MNTKNKKVEDSNNKTEEKIIKKVFKKKKISKKKIFQLESLLLIQHLTIQ